MSGAGAPPPRRSVAAEDLISVAAAVLVAAAICLTAWLVLPKDLGLSTDIVGYPIAYDFNPRPYIVGYLLIAVAFPVLSIGAWALLEWRAGRRRPGPLRLPTELPREPEADASATPAALAYLKAAAVGGLIATALAVGIDASTTWPLALGLPVVVGYVAVVRAAAEIPRRRGRALTEAMAAINGALGALGALAIVVASESIEVVSPQGGQGYPLAPRWLLIVVALALAAWVWSRLWLHPGAASRKIERRVLMLVVLPAFVYLTIASVPGELAPPDMFHEGERLGGSELVFGAGEFPWRDVLFAHGFHFDAAGPALGQAIVEESRWGLDAAVHLFERPLFWLATLLVCVLLFRRNWVFLLASQALLVLGWFDQLENSRMVLMPVTLLALAALLTRPTWPRAFALMAVTLTQAVVVPEATGYSLAAWAVVVAFELSGRRTTAAPPWRESRTVRAAAAGGVLGVAFVVFLAANDAAVGFADYYRTFVGGHDLTGAYEIKWDDFEFAAWAVLPLLVVLAGWAYGAVRMFSGRWLTVEEWVVAAAVIGLIAYYLKFLARADAGHLYQVGAVAVIPALYVIYRLIEAADARARRSDLELLAYRPASVLGLLAVVLLAPTSVSSVIRELPDRFTADATAEPQSERLGYLHPGSPTPELVERVQAVVDEHASAGTVFDFTNSPLLFSDLLDAETATRFYHVSMAIRGETQEELIAELEEQRPELVAYSSRDQGLASWDGISNPVRHYLVSDYLLDHYEPVEEVEGYVFLARRNQPARAQGGLLFAGPSCEWHYAPEFLDQAPADDASNVAVGVRERGRSTLVAVSGWAASPRARPASQILIANGEQVVGRLEPVDQRPDVAAALGAPADARLGFHGNDLVVRGDASAPGSLAFYGAGRGRASVLGESEQTPESLRLPGGGEVAVVPGAFQGSVDRLQAAPVRRYELDPPADFSTYNWLRVSSSDALGESLFVLADRVAGMGRAISFRSLGRLDSTAEQVRVGACPQWKGYRGGLALSVAGEAPAPTVTLLR